MKRGPKRLKQTSNEAVEQTKGVQSGRAANDCPGASLKSKTGGDRASDQRDSGTAISPPATSDKPIAQSDGLESRRSPQTGTSARMEEQKKFTPKLNGHFASSQPPAAKPDVNPDFAARQDQYSEGMQIPSSFPSVAPLSLQGEKFLENPRFSPEELLRLLASFGVIDFEPEQIAYHARLSFPNSSGARATFMKRAALLQIWNEKGETRCRQYFKAAQKENSSESADLKKRCTLLERKLSPQSIHTSPPTNKIVLKMPTHAPKPTTPAQDFFVVGQIFAHIENTPKGKKATHGLEDRLSRKIVIHSSDNYSVCVRVGSFGSHATSARADFSSNTKHVPLRDAALKVRQNRPGIPEEAAPSKEPLAVELHPGEFLEDGCQVCFHTPYKIKHNIRVANIGRIADPTSLEALKTYVRELHSCVNFCS